MTAATKEDRVRARKQWLKRLAFERRNAWMIAVRPRSLDGATRIHTKNEIIHLEDGVIAHVFDATTEAPIESSMVGMRVVGWVGDDHRVHHEYLPGTRAIFWRRENDGEYTSLAMTSRILAFLTIRKTSVTGSVTLPARSSPAPRSKSPRSDGRPRSGVRRTTTRA